MLVHILLSRREGGRERPNPGLCLVVRSFTVPLLTFASSQGTGGKSIYGEKFADENFKRKHTKPGLLSMANAGPNTYVAFLLCSKFAMILSLPSFIIVTSLICQSDLWLMTFLQ